MNNRFVDALSCIASLLGGGWIQTPFKNVSAISDSDPSISSAYRKASLEKARAVHKMGNLRTLFEWLTAETEETGEGKLLLTSLWKAKCRQFIRCYVMPWSE